MQLSKRMQKLASLVTEENRLADIGTDHGYIPIVLVQEGKIPSALAMDINPGPLARATAHIEASGLTTYIKTRLSDGLERLTADEAQSVLIAGMGGILTVHILEGGAHCLPSVQELILQPQSDIHLVRQWLWAHQYRIIIEDIVEEDGKFYPMMKAVHGQEQAYTEAEWYYGRTSLQQSPKVLLAYLEKRYREAQKIQKRLLWSAQDGSRRMQEVKKEMDDITATARTVRKRVFCS